ncbi:MAG TPA: S8 family serine peptidase [Actinomycetota bacterium]|nr:S8 family serine peptidase [Actinomycetota bacterium]
MRNTIAGIRIARETPEKPIKEGGRPGRGPLAVLLALALVATGSATAASGTNAVPKSLTKLVQIAEQKGEIRLLISLRSMQAQQTVLDQLEGTDTEVLIRYDLLPYLLLKADAETVRSLVANPLVTGFTEDLPQPPALNSSIAVINGDDVRNVGLRGGGTAVAVLDTGIDLDHPFIGSVVSEACYSNAGGSGSGVSLCPDGTNSQTGGGSADAETAQCLNMGNNICDHGSHVAGIAMGDGTGVTGAPTAGVAPDADLVGIQVFTRFNAASDCGSDPAPCVRTYASDQVLGLQRVLALQTGNTLASEIVAANMSLGNTDNLSTPCDTDSRKAAIDLLIAQNVATVISAGNEGHPAGVGTPGCISTAITVGSTTDTDGISGFSNRGTRLDLFAPGSAIDSSTPDDGYSNFDGTSMAAPHVAGAWAVLRGEYPNESVADILSTLQDTGVDISYSSGGNSITTPRIDLLAAVQDLNGAPVIARDNANATVDEGQTASNTGTFSDPEGDAVTLTSSIGTVTDTGGGKWAWSFATNDGPTQGQTVTITATDDKGESTSVTFPLVVNNVAPSVTVDPAQVKSIAEGDFVTANATFSDPGWADTYSSVIDWGTPAGDMTDPASTATTADGPPQDQGTSTGSFQYGDDGTFDVDMSVTDDDGGTGTDTFTVEVANVAPTALIDLGGATNVNGTPTIIGQSGQPVSFSARSTDPGSDDITATWDWGNGGASPDVTTEYLVNGPLPDPPHLFNPAFSPSVQPRDVTDSKSNTFGDACEYDVTFGSADDDGGSASDAVQVIITGLATKARGAGYWQNQYRGLGPNDFTAAQLDCLLTVVGHMSTVFNEERDASTRAKAFEVIKANASNMSNMLDRFLITAWLNFGNGYFELGDQVDTNRDGTPDTTFGAALATAEAVRLDPNATRAQLEQQKNILENISGN